MSLKPAHIVQPPFFYPAGNTPAVCLTQSLPPDRDATLLLLGCGDIRTILFTVYGGAGTGGRKLDFTCCDLEAEVIARNAVALAVIVDDVQGVRVQQLWNLYYHVFIDNDTSLLLQAQARKLLNHSESLTKWEQGPYGDLIRFCDSTTFANVVKLWELYAIESTNQSRHKEIQNMVKSQWDAAKRFKNKKISNNDGFPLDGLRSSAPLLHAGFADIKKQYKTYWDSGTCFEGKKSIKKCNIANPMFACYRSGLILHYGSEPLWGFHLALVHAQLSADSPLRATEAESQSEKGMPRGLRAALTQLGAWCRAFRDVIGNVTIRYVNSDAIAFCHVLQHHRTHKESRTANWYRGSWNYAALVLDSTDYHSSGHAPTSFDVIDTSNLVDHLGSMNVMAATVPLLSPDQSSTLRTEMLVPREMNVADSAKTLLSGELPTMAFLLGLKPVQYWANATATWHFNESLWNSFGGDDIGRALSRHIVVWKPANIAEVRYEAIELAKLVYNLHLEMFQDESWARRLQILGLKNKDALLKKVQSYEVYTRASLAVILGYLKSTHVVDWLPFIRSLVEKILNDRTLNMGPHHFQSYFVHLDMLGLNPLEEYPTFQQDLQPGPFRSWTKMPSVVCVTLVVPHSAVAMFEDINDCNGTPLCQLQIRSSVSMKESIFPDIQLGFGNVTIYGTPYTNDYRLCVEDDRTGWKGKSPLVVSAMVSSGSLVEYGDTSCGVVFGLKGTPANAANFTSTLGILLHLHASAVGQKDVFVTRFRPNMTGHISVQCGATPAITGQDVDIAVRPCFDYAASRIISLQTRFSIKSLNVKTALQNAASVEVQLLDPFRLNLKIGDKFQKDLKLPLPLHGDHGKTKIARKSLWIEYSAPIAELRLLAARPDSVFPVSVSPGSELLLDHLHYVSPDVLPKIHNYKSKAGTDWLTGSTSMAMSMSSTELAEYEKARISEDSNMAGRLGVKESLFSMFMHIFGLQNSEKATIFGLQGGSSDFATIFVDAVRMDVSNQTVFLDAACISLHDQLNHDFGMALLTIKNLKVVFIKAGDKEVPFWKHLLPAFAERCRSWKHKSTCEYMSEGKAPLSAEPGKRYICSCGLGIFPDGYLKNLTQFQRLSKYAVRVAIPVIFASPISPDDVGTSTSSKSSPQSATPIVHQQNGHAASRIDNLDAKKNTCFACGAKKGKDGGMLMKCSRCKFAQYCSADCQKGNWKEHKHICKQLKDMDTET